MAQQNINVSTPNDGLGDTLRTSQVKAQSNFTELYSLKVDKSGTKVLSDTNFTQLEKDKLAGLVTDGQLQSNWTEGSILSKAYILNKPTNVSQFFNDSKFVPDVAIVGGFLRSAGEWVALTLTNIVSALGFTPENVANKSDSYTASSSTTYASTKAVVDGLDTKASSTGSANYIQNQNASAQSANMWISGGIITNSYIDLIRSGLTSSAPIRFSTNGTNDWFIGQSPLGTSTEGLSFYSYGTGSVILDLNKTNGAATFSSSVTATSFNGSATLTGTPTAPTATAGTNTTQIATTAFVQATRPYKIYTALLTQTLTNAPVATVLENTLGGTIVWSRTSAGFYEGTLSGAFTSNKTTILNSVTSGIILTINPTTSTIQLETRTVGNVNNDSLLIGTTLEIRVYN